ncbi:MAG: ferritin-like domain-containing protein [bacterium]
MAQSKSEVVAMLNRDIELEHAAIVQYLVHAYTIGEGTMACKIEEIAREEMYHLNWLSKRVVELGGDPTINRGPMDLEGDLISTLLQYDVKAEEGAIALYREHIEAIEDPKIKALLSRIVSDEEAHHESFRGMIEGVRGKDEDVIKREPLSEPKDVEYLSSAVKGEYGAVLMYLHQYFVTSECPLSKELLERAIEEMKHIGWLSERTAELGGKPSIEYPPDVNLRGDVPGIIAAGLDRERWAEEDYQKGIKSLKDPEARSLLERIYTQEVYHEDFFSGLQDGPVKTTSPTSGGKEKVGEEPPQPDLKGKLTVGSLLNRKQED